MTPLHYACNKGHVAVVEILIKYGADLFKRSEVSRLTMPKNSTFRLMNHFWQSYETPLDVTRSKQIKNLLSKLTRGNY